MPETTQAAATFASAAALAGPVGVTVGAIATATAGVYDTFKSFLSAGLSPRPEWSEANAIAHPTAIKLTGAIVDKLGGDAPGKILPVYAAKLKQYILTSAHSDPRTRYQFASAVEQEAERMEGGFRLDAFPFDVLSTSQLAWAIWLHALWLYGNVSRNEIVNKNALRKFNESLEPTLVTAIVETTGEKIDPKTNTNVFGPGSVPNGAKDGSTTKATLGNNTFMIILLAGVAFGLIYFSARGKE